MATERTRQIWREIVAVANADANSPALDDAWDQLSDTLAKENPYMGDPGGYYPDGNYQPQLRKILSWLCAKNPSPEETTEVIALVREHIENITRVVWFDREHPGDPNGFKLPPSEPGEPEVVYTYRYSDPYPEPPCHMWQLHATVSCYDSFDMLCDFIVSEHTKYHERELKRARKEKFVPLVLIRHCDRSDCQKFAVPRRIDRKAFCSPNCCAMQHQREKPREEKSDAQFLWRLSKVGKPVLRARLKEAEIKTRLEAIHTKWPRLRHKAAEFLALTRKD